MRFLELIPNTIRQMRLGARFAVIASGVLAFTALAAPSASGADLKLGFSLKHLGTQPWVTGGLNATAPSMDQVLIAIRWENVQTRCSEIKNGVFDWKKIDKAAENVAAQGLTMIATLKDGPECTRTRHGDNPKPKWVDEWAIFARELVKRYGPGGSEEHRPIRAVEVWSEENLRLWQGSVASYAQAFLKVEKQVRRENPRVKVIVGGPGFCCGPERYLKKLFKIKRMQKRGTLVGAHTYGKSPRWIMRQLKKVRKVLPRKAKLVITEHGWSTCQQPTKDSTASARPERPGKQDAQLRRGAARAAACASPHGPVLVSSPGHVDHREREAVPDRAQGLLRHLHMGRGAEALKRCLGGTDGRSAPRQHPGEHRHPQLHDPLNSAGSAGGGPVPPPGISNPTPVSKARLDYEQRCVDSACSQLLSNE